MRCKYFYKQLEADDLSGRTVTMSDGQVMWGVWRNVSDVTPGSVQYRYNTDPHTHSGITKSGSCKGVLFVWAFRSSNGSTTKVLTNSPDTNVIDLSSGPINYGYGQMWMGWMTADDYTNNTNLVLTNG